MKTKSKIPALRFKGFTDAWEQRKLIDYLEVSKEKNKNEVFGKEDVLSVSGDYGIVNQIEFQGRSFAGASVAPYGIVDTGDIVYTKSPLKSNPYGIIKANKGKTGIVSTLYAVYKPLDNVCSDFVQIYFEQDARMNNYMRPLVNKGAKNDMKVSDVNALKGKVCFPSKYEQIKISEHFAKLDRLIALHQRKCEQTKELKKTMLQKMFPKKGERIPEIRFPEFTDEWEERKLRDLLNKNSEKNKNLSVINVESISNKTGFTKQTDQFEDYSVASADLSNYYVIREKQFAYNPSRINVGSIAYKDLGDEISVVSPLYVSFSTKKVLNDGFLWNWFKTASFDAQRQRLSEGGVRDTLSFNQLSEMNTMFPTYPEQEKIGSFFKQLDDTITLHQRKLDLLKELKKTLLRQLFV